VLKSYTTRVIAVDCFGDAIIHLPDEMVKELGWTVGDELDFEIVDESIIIKNLTKNKME
jgi:antitoxin component of MazEF toxin-antitoxin module